MKTRHVRHEFFLSNFAINSMKKKNKERSQFCALEKLHFKGMFQQTLERREETRHGGGIIFQRRKFLKCLRKRAVSGSEAGY